MSTYVHYCLFDKAIRHFRRSDGPIRVLELGCADGELVEALIKGGYEAVGCDIPHYSAPDASNYSHMFKQDNPNVFTIALNPYRLPFEDESFDFVLSCNVFEHVANKKETLDEIKRVLKPGGYTLNAFPSKWYLPVEPHILVPFVSWMWPKVPNWWLDVWAMLGVRNRYQYGFDWRRVAKDNKRFCREAISYISGDDYRLLVSSVFGSYSRPSTMYVRWHVGRAARLLTRFPAFFHRFLLLFRENFFVAQKITASEKPQT